MIFYSCNPCRACTRIISDLARSSTPLCMSPPPLSYEELVRQGNPFMWIGFVVQGFYAALALFHDHLSPPSHGMERQQLRPTLLLLGTRRVRKEPAWKRTSLKRTSLVVSFLFLQWFGSSPTFRQHVFDPSKLNLIQCRVGPDSRVNHHDEPNHRRWRKKGQMVPPATSGVHCSDLYWVWVLLRDDAERTSCVIQKNNTVHR